MKRIGIILAACACWFASCNKFLEVPIEDNLSTSNFFKTGQDFSMALTGVYNVLTSAEWAPGHRWGNYFEGMLYLGRVGTDECHVIFGSHEHQIGNYTHTPSNYIVSRTWFVQYLGIARANTIIDRIQDADVDIDEVDRNTILGEAHFLRGFFYFNLARFYGEVPLVLNEVVDVSTLDTEKAPLADVYRQVVEDFELAEQLLPVTNANGRAHRYAAAAMLAKAYLQMSGQPLQDVTAAALAEAAAERVISSGLFDLVTNYFSLFDASNEYSSEYLFDVEFSNTEDATRYGGQVGTIEGVPTPYDLYWQKVRTTEEFYEKFDAADNRRNSIADFRYILSGGELVQDRDPAAIGGNYYVYKFRHPLRAEDRGSTWVNWSNPINFPITRYADVLLIHAEASTRANNAVTAQALENLNKVRRRGFGRDTHAASDIDLGMMAADEFLDAVLLERHYELCFEGHRWFDLVRYGKLEEAVRSIGRYPTTREQTDQAVNFRPHHVILPIPQDVIDASNGAISQNPLWN